MLIALTERRGAEGRSGMEEVVRLTAVLAATTTLLLLALATPLAWTLARRRAWWTAPVASLTSLPLVLPPTVLGFYLLVALGPAQPADGAPAPLLGVRTLAFTFTGLVIGSLFYSLPFAVQPLRSGLRGRWADEPLEAARDPRRGLACSPIFRRVAAAAGAPRATCRPRPWCSRIPWASSAWC